MEYGQLAAEITSVASQSTTALLLFTFRNYHDANCAKTSAGNALASSMQLLTWTNPDARTTLILVPACSSSGMRFGRVSLGLKQDLIDYVEEENHVFGFLILHDLDPSWKPPKSSLSTSSSAQQADSESEASDEPPNLSSEEDGEGDSENENENSDSSGAPALQDSTDTEESLSSDSEQVPGLSTDESNESSSNDSDSDSAPHLTEDDEEEEETPPPRPQQQQSKPKPKQPTKPAQPFRDVSSDELEDEDEEGSGMPYEAFEKKFKAFSSEQQSKAKPTKPTKIPKKPSQRSPSPPTQGPRTTPQQTDEQRQKRREERERSKEEERKRKEQRAKRRAQEPQMAQMDPIPTATRPTSESSQPVKPAEPIEKCRLATCQIPPYSEKNNFNIRDTDERAQVECFSGCRVVYHQHCWSHMKKKLKDEVNSVGKRIKGQPHLSKHRCPTPDCGDWVRSVTTYDRKQDENGEIRLVPETHSYSKPSSRPAPIPAAAAAAPTPQVSTAPPQPARGRRSERDQQPQPQVQPEIPQPQPSQSISQTIKIVPFGSQKAAAAAAAAANGGELTSPTIPPTPPSGSGIGVNSAPLQFSVPLPSTPNTTTLPAPLARSTSVPPTSPLSPPLSGGSFANQPPAAATDSTYIVLKPEIQRGLVLKVPSTTSRTPFGQIQIESKQGQKTIAHVLPFYQKHVLFGLELNEGDVVEFVEGWNRVTQVDLCALDIRLVERHGCTVQEIEHIYRQAEQGPPPPRQMPTSEKSIESQFADMNVPVKVKKQKQKKKQQPVAPPVTRPQDSFRPPPVPDRFYLPTFEVPVELPPPPISTKPKIKGPMFKPTPMAPPPAPVSASTFNDISQPTKPETQLRSVSPPSRLQPVLQPVSTSPPPPFSRQKSPPPPPRSLKKSAAPPPARETSPPPPPAPTTTKKGKSGFPDDVAALNLNPKAASFTPAPAPAPESPAQNRSNLPATAQPFIPTTDLLNTHLPPQPQPSSVLNISVPQPMFSTPLQTSPTAAATMGSVPPSLPSPHEIAQSLQLLVQPLTSTNAQPIYVNGFQHLFNPAPAAVDQPPTENDDHDISEILSTLLVNPPTSYQPQPPTALSNGFQPNSTEISTPDAGINVHTLLFEKKILEQRLEHAAAAQEGLQQRLESSEAREQTLIADLKEEQEANMSLSAENDDLRNELRETKDKLEKVQAENEALKLQLALLASSRPQPVLHQMPLPPPQQQHQQPHVAYMPPQQYHPHHHSPSFAPTYQPPRDWRAPPR